MRAKRAYCPIAGSSHTLEGHNLDCGFFPISLLLPIPLRSYLLCIFLILSLYFDILRNKNPYYILRHMITSFHTSSFLPLLPSEQMSRVKADVRSPVRVALIRDICELYQRGRKEETKAKPCAGCAGAGGGFL